VIQNINIGEINDRFREHIIDTRVVFSIDVLKLKKPELKILLNKISEKIMFGPECPDHNFGVVRHQSKIFFWRIYNLTKDKRFRSSEREKQNSSNLQLSVSLVK